MENENKEDLKHAILSQIEEDFKNQDFEALDELFNKMFDSDYNLQFFMNYLGDSIKELWIEDKVKRYW